MGMNDINSLSHTKWNCKYHIVFAKRLRGGGRFAIMEKTNGKGSCSMEYPRNFIRGTTAYNTFEKHVPAPCFRKTFEVSEATAGRVVITACGFYELHVNGIRYTKGAFAPYVSDTDHILYYDVYDLPLKAGKNVVAVLLGNGLQNNPGGYIWDFDRLPYRGAPQFALRLSWAGDGSSPTPPSAPLPPASPSMITASASILTPGRRNRAGWSPTLTIPTGPMPSRPLCPGVKPGSARRSPSWLPRN